MKRVLCLFITLLMVFSISGVKYAKADTSSIKVTKAYYINNGKDLNIRVNIKNTGTAAFGGIYKVTIIILDKNNSLIVNNIFKDPLLKDKIIQPGKELNWEFVLPNAKKGDLSKMTSAQAYLSWSGANMKGGSQTTSEKATTEKKQQLKITKIEYLENNTKLRLYGMFVNRSSKKYTKISDVKIKIYDSDDNLIASAVFNDDKLKDSVVLSDNQLNWRFIIGNPKIGDITSFRAETSFTFK